MYVVQGKGNFTSGIWNQTNLGSYAKWVTLDKLLNLAEPTSTFEN